MDDNYMQQTGRIFDIQRYSIHDGTGIRTIVFLKGCVLRCRWCCNPESQEYKIQEMVVAGKKKIIGRDVTVAEVMQEVMKDGDYYRNSDGGLTLSGGECLCQPDFAAALLRAAKENGMYDQFTKCFMAEIEKIKASLTKKHGTKKTDKVMERLGRARQKYPSVSSHYDYAYTEEDCTVTSLECTPKEGYDFNEKAGVYFLQTNLDDKDCKDGVNVWKIYNILKEVESSFRCMKTDLDLRPIYHKSDVACLAHLHLGILAYWVVTSIRYQLCQKGINKTWSQILDIMLTQKSVTSEAKNLQDEPIHIEQCSEPTTEVSQIYDNVSISHEPYKPQKSVWAQIRTQKNEPPNDDGVT